MGVRRNARRDGVCAVRGASLFNVTGRHGERHDDREHANQAVPRKSVAARRQRETGMMCRCDQKNGGWSRERTNVSETRRAQTTKRRLSSVDWYRIFVAKTREADEKRDVMTPRVTCDKLGDKLSGSLSTGAHSSEHNESFYYTTKYLLKYSSKYFAYDKIGGNH
jgi:hypothetical protein